MFSFEDKVFLLFLELPACVFLCVSTASAEARRCHQILWDWSPAWVLGAELGYMLLTLKPFISQSFMLKAAVVILKIMALILFCILIN